MYLCFCINFYLKKKKYAKFVKTVCNLKIITIEEIQEYKIDYLNIFFVLFGIKNKLLSKELIKKEFLHK